MTVAQMPAMATVPAVRAMSVPGAIMGEPQEGHDGKTRQPQRESKTVRVHVQGINNSRNPGARRTQ